MGYEFCHKYDQGYMVVLFKALIFLYQCPRFFKSDKAVQKLCPITRVIDKWRAKSVEKNEKTQRQSTIKIFQTLEININHGKHT